MTKISNYIFFDIETVPCAPSLDEASEQVQNSFIGYCQRRFLKEDPNASIDQLFLDKAALLTEFSDIACISVGRIKDSEYKVSTLMNDSDDSSIILKKFANYLDKLGTEIWLSGYNIIAFDIPFIIKHMIKNNIKVPQILNMYFAKPWERHIFDIFDFWKGLRYEYMPSLEMVSTFLSCGNPKENMQGFDVGKYFWGLVDGVSREEARSLIKKYCEGDVISSMCILEKLMNTGCL